MTVSMNPSEEVAHHRLGVLELAQALGNVSAACRHRGMIRGKFYDYKRRFELQGLEGLKDLPPKTFYESVEALQCDLEQWLLHYTPIRSISGVYDCGEVLSSGSRLFVQFNRFLCTTQYLCTPLDRSSRPG
jgi:hypothetical protein